MIHQSSPVASTLAPPLVRLPAMTLDCALQDASSPRLSPSHDTGFTGHDSLSPWHSPSGNSRGPLLTHNTGFTGHDSLGIHVVRYSATTLDSRATSLSLFPARPSGNSRSPTPVRLPLSLRPAPGKAALKRGFRAPVTQGCNPCHLLPRKVLIW